MTVYAPIKKQEIFRVPNSSYPKTENKLDAAANAEAAAKAAASTVK